MRIIRNPKPAFMTTVTKISRLENFAAKWIPYDPIPTENMENMSKTVMVVITLEPNISFNTFPIFLYCSFKLLSSWSKFLWISISLSMDLISCSSTWDLFILDMFLIEFTQAFKGLVWLRFFRWPLFVEDFVKQQDPKSNRYDSILQWLQMEK